MTGFEEGSRAPWIKFTFKEPMLVNQFAMVYAAINKNYLEYGSSDPKEWKLKIKNFIFPYEEIELVQKSKYISGYTSDENLRPKQGEIERFIFDNDFLTKEITLTFTKIRDYDYNTYCRDVAIQGV